MAEDKVRVVVIRIGELFLKGKNRGFFEKILIQNIKDKLADTQCKLATHRNRYVVYDYAERLEAEIISKLQTVFGIHSLSAGYRVRSEFELIANVACDMMQKSGSFRVSANRGDKRFSLNSMEIGRELGGRILGRNAALTVDLHNPDTVLNVDVREDGYTYLFCQKIAGAGGMPVGSAGQGLLLLSGGIDSPVAGYMMAKRGLRLHALHFHSYPFTSEAAQQKVETLAEILQVYCGHIPLIMVPFTKIQELIHVHCSDSFMITIMRRIMMRIAERIAVSRACGCLVNGESLGQVASQTLESMTVTNAVIEGMPVLRPLVGLDKQEIIDISLRIGTYDTSVLPYEDCCTVFLPPKPVIKPKLKQCIYEESKIPNLEQLIEDAIQNAVIKE